MKAIRIHQTGGPEALRLDDLPSPEPGTGEALIEVAAIGLNYIDVYFRTGLYRAPLPMTLGLEGAGTVRALGAGASEVAVGDRVAWVGVPGAYAEMAVVPAARLVKLPAALSFRDGAAAMLRGMTAHYLACSTYALSRETPASSTPPRFPPSQTPGSFNLSKIMKQLDAASSH